MAMACTLADNKSAMLRLTFWGCVFSSCLISKVANFRLLRQSQLSLRATYDSLRSDDLTL